MAVRDTRHGIVPLSAGVALCAGLLLSGCGQRGALYMPGSTPPQSKHAHFIFGGDTQKSSNSAKLVAQPAVHTTVNPPGVARPFVPAPNLGVMRDDPTLQPNQSGQITVGPDVATPATGSAS